MEISQPVVLESKPAIERMAYLGYRYHAKKKKKVSRLVHISVQKATDDPLVN